MLSKNVCNQLVTKANAIDTQIPSNSGLKMLTKRQLILVGWIKRLITTQKLQRSKTRYYYLLLLL